MTSYRKRIKRGGYDGEYVTDIGGKEVITPQQQDKEQQEKQKELENQKQESQKQEGGYEINLNTIMVIIISVFIIILVMLIIYLLFFINSKQNSFIPMNSIFKYRVSEPSDLNGLESNNINRYNIQSKKIPLLRLPSSQEIL